MPEHGTNSNYSAGCRCRACQQAHSDYMRDYRFKKNLTNKASKLYKKVKVSEWPYTMDEWLKLSADDFWTYIAMLGEDTKTPISPPEPPRANRRGI